MKRRTPKPEQLPLFEPVTDTRPAGERTASERYSTPTLMSWIAEKAQDPATDKPASE